jgi:glutamate:GABA antiporter
MQENNKMGLGTFIGLTMALCATVRSIPTLAATGWLLLAYLLFAIIFFAGPICAMAGELSTMLPGEGGPQLWVKTALGEKWGFVVAWLLWVQMFPGMVMVASVLGPTLGNTFGFIELGNNHYFTLTCILSIYWVITLLNLKFDMAKVGGNFGVWLGVYIPVMVLFVLGALTSIKIGINPLGGLGNFSFDKLIPNLNDVSSFKYLAGIVFIFVGIEISSVYMPRLKDATHNYTKGVYASLLGLVLLNFVNALLVANVVPSGKLELSNITQPVLIECQYLGIPTIAANVFSFMVFIGVVLQLSAWVTGPSKTIIAVAQQGLLPPSFGYYKENKYGVSKNVVLTQSVIISLFALLYGVMEDVNGVFLTLTNATTIVYCIVYVLIAISLLKLRKSMPDAPRAYRIGNHGNMLAYLMSAVVILSIFIVLLATLATTSFMDAMLVTIISVVLFIMPLLIYRMKSTSWSHIEDGFGATEGVK